MMSDYGEYEIFIYAGEDNEAICDEYISVFTNEEQESWCGPHDPNALYAYPFDATLPSWTTVNVRASAEISRRGKPNSNEDLVLVLGGHANLPMRDMLPGFPIVEYGIGYSGVFSQWKCFESHIWQHQVYGLCGSLIGTWNDTVIPNYFDPLDFLPSKEPRVLNEPYLLFLGRIVKNKGPEIAAQIADRMGLPLVVAGQGGTLSDGKVVAEEVTFSAEKLHYVGPVNATQRAGLMQNAIATLVPTLYVEPFGGVAVESMMCGTPAITTDYGAFVETVDEDWRFSTLSEAVKCVEYAAITVDRDFLRKKTAAKYGLDVIAPKYDKWFHRIMQLVRGEWAA
jgi:glycosyltransferase involved in cell wall biosynthesis